MMYFVLAYLVLFYIAPLVYLITINNKKGLPRLATLHLHRSKFFRYILIEGGFSLFSFSIRPIGVYETTSVSFPLRRDGSSTKPTGNKVYYEVYPTIQIGFVEFKLGNWARFSFAKNRRNTDVIEPIWPPKEDAPNKNGRIYKEDSGY